MGVVGGVRVGGGDKSIKTKREVLFGSDKK